MAVGGGSIIGDLSGGRLKASGMGECWVVILDFN
jgi:hypothetical protein